MLPHADLLEFEQRWRRPCGAKDEAIRRELRITPVRYYMLLKRAAESLDGIAAHPVTARLVRERQQRQAAIRSQRTMRHATVKA